MLSNRSNVEAQQPGLLRRLDAAKFCGISPSSWDRLTASGGNPKPIRIRGVLVWNVRELVAWQDAHCPDRETWSAMWEVIVKKGKQ
ncbi:MAG: hypothetical protein R3B84_09975 [Zavarzinella sp.]